MLILRQRPFLAPAWKLHNPYCQNQEAEKAGDKAEKDRLSTRVRFHLSHKFGDEKKLMTFHQELEDVIEDQLSLASIHYLRSHYQEAIDIYKRILLDNREYLALNVYVALCYYKLDYYDVSQEVLAVYLQHFPDSAIAINLKVWWIIDSWQLKQI